MNLHDIKLGILGGGQLGKMLCLAASNWNLQTYVLDPSYDCPSSAVCTNFYSGDLNDYETVYKFGKMVDILTIEIEHVNTDALIRLKEEGLEVRPDPHILKIIQNKGTQKEFYTKNDLPTSDYKIAQNKEEIITCYENGDIKIPFVQKLCKLGYDGKGVKIVKSEDDLNELLDGKSVIEELVDIYKEISVIVSRNNMDQVECFPPVEMLFNSNANLVEYLICPTDLAESIVSDSYDLAINTIKAFDLYGILAVEMFVNNDNKILINEVAPRPHNSGHHTIEASITSQY
ncbi:MAG: ATP-grasp domain-containing protein, partial [Candidatus Dadabacteria bacterium]|nr:ATP-grasp domain-containing protein [Candidatus Dadabacteria bacterium]NIQ13756.1 ATP-grasp domain-containing protein [Candidatus Dadabacteria bacterium]